MTDEIIHSTVTSEEMKPESGDMMNNNGLPGDIVAEREGEDLGLKSIIPDDMIEDTYPSEISDLAGPLKRNPNVVIVDPDHKFIVRSRYRRVSTGSCHDLCKSGHEHEQEKVKKRPLLETIRESRALYRTASGDCDKYLAKSRSEKETKNNALIRRLSLPGSMREKDPLTHIEGTKYPKGIVPIRSNMKRFQSETKQPSVSTPGKSISRSKPDIAAVKKTFQQIKSGQKVKGIKTKEICSPSENRTIKAKEPMMSNSSMTQMEKSPSLKAIIYKNLKGFSRSKYQSILEDAKINNSHDVPKKTEFKIKPNGYNAEKALKSSLPNEESSSTQRESRAGKNKKSNDEKKGARFGLPSFSSPSSSKNQQKSDSISKNQQNSDSISTLEIDKVIDEKGGTKTSKSRGKSIVNIQPKAKRTGMSNSEEKDGLAWKVRFRRGTVTNPQVANDSSRKLRFKRGRILGGDQSVKAEVQKGLMSHDDVTNELPDTNPEPEKFRLRRQETSGKKDSVDLNNVIEETASKLVKTRKSKVKALVGAFETVMSFNDREPSGETSAS